MAVRRLINVLRALAAKGDPQGVRNDRQVAVRNDGGTDDFIIRARVESAGQASVTISTPSGTVAASLATDEPLVAGQNVWALRSDDGSYLVLGSIS